MTNMPGNMMKITHAEAVKSNVKPESQTSGFHEFPKQVGWSKPTEAEAKEAERTKIPFVPKAIIAKNPDEATRYAATGSTTPAKPAPVKGAWGSTAATAGYPKQVGLTKPTPEEAAAAKKTGVPFVPKPIMAANADEEAKYLATA